MGEHLEDSMHQVMMMSNTNEVVHVRLHDGDPDLEPTIFVDITVTPGSNTHAVVESSTIFRLLEFTALLKQYGWQYNFSEPWTQLLWCCEEVCGMEGSDHTCTGSEN